MFTLRVADQTLEAVVVGTERFRVGDRVFGATGFGMGAYADYVTMPEAGSLTPSHRV